MITEEQNKKLLQRVKDLKYEANGCNYSDNSTIINLIIELADIVEDTLIINSKEVINN